METAMITKKELAALYKCHPNTMSTRLKAIGLKSRKRIPPKVLQFIFQEFGTPNEDATPAKHSRIGTN